ncbi:MAG: hypothetical protein WD276_09950 [Actinomycetota bacterium]
MGDEETLLAAKLESALAGEIASRFAPVYGAELAGRVAMAHAPMISVQVAEQLVQKLGPQADKDVHAPQVARDIAADLEKEMAKVTQGLIGELRAGASQDELGTQLAKQLEPQMGPVLAADLAAAILTRAEEDAGTD